VRVLHRWGAWARGLEERLVTWPAFPRERAPSPPDRVKRVVGNIKPQKDYALALPVARELLRRDGSWRFLIVGDCLKAGSVKGVR